MFDENDRSRPDDTARHIRRGARHDDDKTIEVDSSAFLKHFYPGNWFFGWIRSIL